MPDKSLLPLLVKVAIPALLGVLGSLLLTLNPTYHSAFCAGVFL